MARSALGICLLAGALSVRGEGMGYGTPYSEPNPYVASDSFYPSVAGTEEHHVVHSNDGSRGHHVGHVYDADHGNDGMTAMFNKRRLVTNPSQGVSAAKVSVDQGARQAVLQFGDQVEQVSGSPGMYSRSKMDNLIHELAREDVGLPEKLANFVQTYREPIIGSSGDMGGAASVARDAMLKLAAVTPGMGSAMKNFFSASQDVHTQAAPPSGAEPRQLAPNLGGMGAADLLFAPLDRFQEVASSFGGMMGGMNPLGGEGLVGGALGGGPLGSALMGTMDQFTGGNSAQNIAPAAAPKQPTSGGRHGATVTNSSGPYSPPGHMVKAPPMASAYATNSNMYAAPAQNALYSRPAPNAMYGGSAQNALYNRPAAYGGVQPAFFPISKAIAGNATIGNASGAFAKQGSIGAGAGAQGFSAPTPFIGAQMGYPQMGYGQMNQMGQPPMGQGQANYGHMGQMGQGQMGHAQMGHAQMGQGQVGQAQMGQAQMGQGQRGPASMSQGQMGHPQMGYGQMGYGQGGATGPSGFVNQQGISGENIPTVAGSEYMTYNLQSGSATEGGFPGFTDLFPFQKSLTVGKTLNVTPQTRGEESATPREAVQAALGGEDSVGAGRLTLATQLSGAQDASRRRLATQTEDQVVHAGNTIAAIATAIGEQYGNGETNANLAHTLVRDYLNPLGLAGPMAQYLQDNFPYLATPPASPQTQTDPFHKIYSLFTKVYHDGVPHAV